MNKDKYKGKNIYVFRTSKLVLNIITVSDNITHVECINCLVPQVTYI